MCLDLRRALQIGDGARQLQDAVESSGAANGHDFILKP